MKDSTPQLFVIKEKMKEIWSAGDFGVIAKIIESVGIDFISRLNIKPDSKVLDVACGTGNLAIPAAKTGAQVTGLDFVPALIKQAKEKAETENLDIKFDVGDAESMPYPNNEFDFVVTMFGAMFCPRPDVTTRELIRVCKPGGTVAMANWTPEGFVGRFFKLGASYMPPPPGMPSPIIWGTESAVKERFGNYVSDLILNRRIARWIIPMHEREVAEHFIKYFGPTNKLFELLDSESRIKFKNELTELYIENNISKTGTVTVDAEYLEVVATKK
jgi:ubiquinone/menaquinone biosynthesis C-methylase UbiE